MFRLFQTAGFGSYYLNDFYSRYNVLELSYNDHKKTLLSDRYGACHLLDPIYKQQPEAFFTVSDDAILQAKWAKENGISDSNLDNILLAQIEQHSTEVFYNLDPIAFPSAFLDRLPSSVKLSIAWRAAPPGNADLSSYSAILSNFSSLNEIWESKGWKTLKFYPSLDPETKLFADNTNRQTDVFFAGSYSRTTGHDERLKILKTISNLDTEYRLDLRLLYRKWGRLSDAHILRWIPCPVFMPKSLRQNNRLPVFGRDMYQALSHARIVLNPATSIAGQERGNMRCWEALGCGSCMLASQGNYPEGFEAGVNFEAYKDVDELAIKVKRLLDDDDRRLEIAKAGVDMLSTVWSKKRQWSDFKHIVASIG